MDGLYYKYRLRKVLLGIVQFVISGLRTSFVSILDIETLTFLSSLS